MVQEKLSNNRLLKLIFPLSCTSKKDFSYTLFQGCLVNQTKAGNIEYLLPDMLFM